MQFHSDRSSLLVSLYRISLGNVNGLKELWYDLSLIKANFLSCWTPTLVFSLQEEIIDPQQDLVATVESDGVDCSKSRSPRTSGNCS